jgi:hypothetical protein
MEEVFRVALNSEYKDQLYNQNHQRAPESPNKMLPETVHSTTAAAGAAYSISRIQQK